VGYIIIVIANYPQSVPVKEFLKSVSNGKDMDKSYVASFFTAHSVLWFFHTYMRRNNACYAAIEAIILLVVTLPLVSSLIHFYVLYLNHQFVLF